jgi:superfamily II DNA or RNA helicase
MVANGFDDVRIIAGTGDKGADVLGVKNGELWIFQCKFTSRSAPSRAALAEVREAGAFYKAQRLAVATSRPPGDAFVAERARYQRMGLEIEIASPAVLLSQMAATPEWPPARRELRKYQEEASQRLRDALLTTGRGQLVLATGLGKTVVMADTVADMLRDGLVPHERVLVLAHTRELVDQLQRAFWFQLPKWVATHRLIEREAPSYWDGITFATVQSAVAALEFLPQFGLILIDEAHRIGGDTFRRIIDYMKPPMLAGVTATPWRGDGFDIDTLLGPPLIRIGIAEGLQRGFLSEVDYRLLADNVDWKMVQSLSRNNYSVGDLNRRLILPLRDEEAARAIRQVFYEERRRAGIVFTPTAAHAVDFAAMLRYQGFRAEAISYETQPRQRAVFMARFRAGDLDFVATVDLFNEGVDVPDVDLLIFMRVTHSRRIFVQQLGRGLRVSPGKKNVVVLDFVTDLRRVAEVVELDREVRGSDVERLGLGSRVIQFHDRSAGSFLKEWMLDQASVLLRQEDASLEMPDFDFPSPVAKGGVQ